MSNPAISVIIPVYNAERYLRRCVDSVLAQSYTDFELLLIDDGSRDQSPAICDEYATADNRVKVLHKPNGGVSSARNVGLDYARGQWITFIDSDDFISINYLSAVRRSNADIIFLNGWLSYSNGVSCQTEILENYTSEMSLKQYLGDNLHKTLLHVPWGKFFKKDLLENHKFKLNQTIGEDAVFMYELLPNVKSIETLRGFVYFWRKSDIPYSSKYKIPPHTAVKFLNEIYNSYLKFDYTNITLEKFLIRGSFSICDKQCISELHQHFFQSTVVQNIHNKLKSIGESLPEDIEYRFYYRYHQFAPLLLNLYRSASYIKQLVKSAFQQR